jgi:hypothetical protein
MVHLLIRASFKDFFRILVVVVKAAGVVCLRKKASACMTGLPLKMWYRGYNPLGLSVLKNETVQDNPTQILLIGAAVFGFWLAE